MINEDMTSKSPALRSVNRPAMVLLAVITLAYAAATLHRNKVWHDEYTLWNDIIAKSQGKSRPHTFLAMAYAKDARYREAEEHFARALTLSPNNPEAHYNLGVMYNQTERLDEAIIEFRKALFSNPALEEPYHALAGAYIESGEYEKAVVFLKQAMKLRGSPVGAWSDAVLGVAYARLGEYANAELHLKRAYRRDPYDPEVLNSLGNLYLLQNRPEEATGYYIKAVALDGGPEPVYNAAAALDRAGRPERAADYYRRFISLDPEGYADAVVRARKRLRDIERRR